VDKRQLGQLLLQPDQKLSAETSQRIEALEAEVETIESQLAQHVAGLGQARHALGVSFEQVQSTRTMARSLNICVTRITWEKTNGSRATEPLCCSRRVRPSGSPSVKR
jgi:hypothetical protein